MKYMQQNINKKESLTEDEWKNGYEAQCLLTRNEMIHYKKLTKWAAKNGVYIFSKVRLADLIKPKQGTKNQALFWKIQAKHVDFVVCDENANVKLIIELQDKTHEREDRIERDKFVKTVLRRCGYRFIPVYNITEEILNAALAGS